MGDSKTPSVLAGVGTPLMDAVERVAQLVSSGRVSRDDGAAFVQRIVWGPMVEFVVKMTPTPLDDVALTMLRALVPRRV